MANKIGDQIHSILANHKEPNDRLRELTAVVAHLCSQTDPQNLLHLLEFALSDDGSLSLFSRTIVRRIVAGVAPWPPSPLKEFCPGAIAALKRRLVSFEEEDGILRRYLAGCLEGEGDFAGAAKCLADGNLENSAKASADEKHELLVKIAELYFRGGNCAAFENFINRAGRVSPAPTDLVQLCRAEELQGELLELRHKFLDAGKRFYALSVQDVNWRCPSGGVGSSAAGGVSPQDAALHRAIRCAVLAPSGPAKAKFLSALVKDSRTPVAPNFGIIDKMHRHKVIGPAEAQQFAENSVAHELAAGQSGLSVVSSAFLQHNILAASRSFRVMKIATMSRIVGTADAEVEKTIYEMILEGRLRAQIDQLTGTVHFAEIPMANEVIWGRQMSLAVDRLDKIVGAISAKHTAEELVAPPATAGGGADLRGADCSKKSGSSCMASRVCAAGIGLS